MPTLRRVCTTECPGIHSQIITLPRYPCFLWQSEK
jgi:hypothetical protein